MFIHANTDNPLAQRPLNLMTRQQGMGWLGDGSPQSPPGSTLLYTASFNPVAAWTTSSAAIQALAPLLPAYGMSLVSQQVTSSGLISNAAFSITVLDSVGHALISDAKSVLDALMNQLTSNGLQSSTLVLVGAGITATGTTTAPGSALPETATDPVTWLENNALYVGLGVLALVVLPALIRKL